MNIWVFLEELQGEPESIGLELLTKARTLSDDAPAAVYLGQGSDEVFSLLGSYGASTVYHMIPGDLLPTAAAAAGLAALVDQHHPDLIMFGLTPTDRDVAGRLSAIIDRPIVSNATDVVVDGDLKILNEIFGGTEIVETVFESEPPYLAVFRPKAFPAEPAEGGTPQVLAVELPDVGPAGAARVIDVHVEEREGPQLEDASIVVTAGRGMGSAENLELTNKLAELLGAAVGATRAVVDVGWVPYSCQVGQTGKTVKPDVYIACGVSGAMQHVVGMKDSKMIIAINKDEEAPIFAISDLGIVGDVNKVLPKLVEALEARKG